MDQNPLKWFESVGNTSHCTDEMRDSDLWPTFIIAVFGSKLSRKRNCRHKKEKKFATFNRPFIGFAPWNQSQHALVADSKISQLKTNISLLENVKSPGTLVA